MGQLTTNLPWVITGLLAFAAAAFLRVVPGLFRLEKIPLAGKEFGSTEKRRLAYLGGARRLYTDGYRNVRTVQAPSVAKSDSIYTSSKMPSGSQRHEVGYPPETRIIQRG
jgi:hypothetical protein